MAKQRKRHQHNLNSVQSAALIQFLRERKDEIEQGRISVECLREEAREQLGIPGLTDANVRNMCRRLDIPKQPATQSYVTLAKFEDLARQVANIKQQLGIV